MGPGIPALLIWLGLFWVAYCTFGSLQRDKVRSPRELMANAASLTGPGPGWRCRIWMMSPCNRSGTRGPFRTRDRPACPVSVGALGAQDEPGSRWMLIKAATATTIQLARLDEARDLGRTNRVNGGSFSVALSLTARASATVAPISPRRQR